MSNTNDFFGTDASNEISLYEYGLLVQPYFKDGKEDEYFCIYSTYNGYFDTGFITEGNVNGYLLGKDFMTDEDIKSFLSWSGTTLDEWLQSNFVNKLFDLLQFWGYENIMGTSYNLASKEEIEQLINNKS